MMMWCTFSQHKLFKILEWILFIGFVIASGWFASGVLRQFFSNKTSFTQYKEKITFYPVVNIIFHRLTSELNPSDVKIKYKASGMDDYQLLELGENYLHNHKYNKTEKVILESPGNIWNITGFRIIHATPILEKNRAKVLIQIEYNVENKTTSIWSDIGYLVITSQKNSPGASFWKWKDGKQLNMNMLKNTHINYNLQPQITKYLKDTNECQEESYYECIGSQLNLMKFDECSNKCIPNIFSNLGRNYSTPFCQDDADNEHCALKTILKINDEKIASNCKKSCSNLEYFGEVVLNMPFYSEKGKNWNMYFLKYRLNNQDFESMVYEEYYIYDTVGMIGSVGGTFGTYYLYLYLSNFKTLNM